MAKPQQKKYISRIDSGHFIRISFLVITSAFLTVSGSAQNPLFIPPMMSGTDFNLNIQSGTQNFYTLPTPTYGINGAFLSPTIVVNKGDLLTLNVTNSLNVATTMHWHGLHVSAMNDGGPHQSIAPGSTWSPAFEVLNQAGTYWYHPHGAGKTELHVSKGLAGLFIVHDTDELALNLPQTYGVDDIPLILQTKAFDVLQQIAIADHMDTAVFANGTLDAFFDAPAQVVRLRLLNGSSMRSFYLGFSNNLTFQQIATDGGLLESPNSLTRLLLAPGERAEVLLDLNGMNGQDVQLLSYASEMPDGIFGSPSLGIQPDTIEGYSMNFLNGTDFTLLDLHVVSATASPVTTIPASLVPYVPFQPADATINREIIFDTLTLLPGMLPNLAEGPFGMNASTFNMDSINLMIPLNSTETWTLINKTHIAHPFHIHDIQFNVLERSGGLPPASEQGWKDVVLVMPHDSVKFITRFTDFADEMTPYMYHCHLLHHEDDGMMGSFIVIDTNLRVNELHQELKFRVYPNPGTEQWNIEGKWNQAKLNIALSDLQGKLLYSREFHQTGSSAVLSIPTEQLERGIYLLSLSTEDGEAQVIQVVKE